MNHPVSHPVNHPVNRPVNPDHAGPFMAEAVAALSEQPPATTLLVVAQLSSPDLLVEIEGIAAR